MLGRAPTDHQFCGVESIVNHTQHFDQNVLPITATALAAPAEKWSSHRRRNRETPLQAASQAAWGRCGRRKAGNLKSEARATPTV